MNILPDNEQGSVAAKASVNAILHHHFSIVDGFGHGSLGRRLFTPALSSGRSYSFAVKSGPELGFGHFVSPALVPLPQAGKLHDTARVPVSLTAGLMFAAAYSMAARTSRGHLPFDAGLRQMKRFPGSVHAGHTHLNGQYRISAASGRTPSVAVPISMPA